MTTQWEHFDHGADIGVRGTGPTTASAFAQAALALTAVICDPETVRPTTTLALHCENSDLELLLVDWLNAVVFEMSTRRMLFSRFDVEIAGGSELDAEITGETVDPARHAPAVEVKGATLTELSVERDHDGQWVAQCVVDV